MVTTLKPALEGWNDKLIESDPSILEHLVEEALFIEPALP